MGLRCDCCCHDEDEDGNTEWDDLDRDTPVPPPICPDCRAEVGPDLHRCRPEPGPADEAGVEALYRDTGGEG